MVFGETLRGIWTKECEGHVHSSLVICALRFRHQHQILGASLGAYERCVKRRTIRIEVHKMAGLIPWIRSFVTQNLKDLVCDVVEIFRNAGIKSAAGELFPTSLQTSSPHTSLLTTSQPFNGLYELWDRSPRCIP
jgi:hypothetical protein